MIESIKVRRARNEDVPDIMDIYNYAILHTTATFDTEPKTLEDRLEWFGEHAEEYPVLVATVGERVVGWGSIRPFGERRAYRYTVENAIYIDCDCQGRGIGTALLRELLVAAEERGYHVMLALVVAGNDASEKLHEKFGFDEVGRMREVGRKFDRWLDLIVYEKKLDTQHFK